MGQREMHRFEISPELYINYVGQDWIVMKAYLNAQLENCISRLIGDISHDEANQVRGQLRIIKTLLDFENQAANSSRLTE